MVPLDAQNKKTANQNIVAPEKSAANRAVLRRIGPHKTDIPLLCTTAGGAPIPLPAGAQATLPAGMPLVVRTTNALSTKTQVAGQSFTAHLEQPLVLNGREVFAKGTEVDGRIVDSDKGGRVKGVATLSVQMTGLHAASGRLVDISTSTITHAANATKKKDAVKIGIGSGVGAAIGAIAGGGRGAAIGAAAGAGAGTGAVLATHATRRIPAKAAALALRVPVTVAG